MRSKPRFLSQVRTLAGASANREGERKALSKDRQRERRFRSLEPPRGAAGGRVCWMTFSNILSLGTDSDNLTCPRPMSAVCPDRSARGLTGRLTLGCWWAAALGSCPGAALPHVLAGARRASGRKETDLGRGRRRPGSLPSYPFQRSVPLQVSCVSTRLACSRTRGPQGRMSGFPAPGVKDWPIFAGQLLVDPGAWAPPGCEGAPRWEQHRRGWAAAVSCHFHAFHSYLSGGPQSSIWSNRTCWLII